MSRFASAASCCSYFLLRDPTVVSEPCYLRESQEDAEFLVLCMLVSVLTCFDAYLIDNMFYLNACGLIAWKMEFWKLIQIWNFWIKLDFLGHESGTLGEPNPWPNGAPLDGARPNRDHWMVKTVWLNRLVSHDKFGTVLTNSKIKCLKVSVLNGFDKPSVKFFETWQLIKTGKSHDVW
jgi:hypothetical protein